jgi:hypothetical protein
MTSRWATAQTHPAAGWGRPGWPDGSYPGTWPAPKIESATEQSLTDALTEASS